MPTAITLSILTEDVPVGELSPAAWNPRTIRDERFQNLCDSIRNDPDFFRLRPVLAMADGTIYAGNMRYRAAVKLGMATVPAIRQDIPMRLAQERAMRDNAQWGEWDEDDLAQLLHQLSEDGSDLGLLGFDDRSLQQLLDRVVADAPEADNVPELPDEPSARPGDVFKLGPHRLICADCTDPAALEELMAGERAACLWTDPPFGVNYVGGTAARLELLNDSPEGIAPLLESAFANLDPWLEPGAALYVVHPAGDLAATFAEAFAKQGWTVRQGLVWVKDAFVLGRSDYHYQHEPILFGYKADMGGGRRGRGGRCWFGGNGASSVFQVPRSRSNADHPTSKPTALIEAMLKNSTKHGEVVLDPFLGSGSTLVAADLLGRRCFGVELDPRYVDVVIERWERLTGNSAEKLGGAS